MGNLPAKKRHCNEGLPENKRHYQDMRADFRRHCQPSLHCNTTLKAARIQGKMFNIYAMLASG
ncbi:hypothetical protein SedNR2807_04250 [Citrobacter sedlakii]|nr:hypothetical protein APU02_16265 [Citrobacter sp. 50677481]